MRHITQPTVTLTNFYECKYNCNQKLARWTISLKGWTFVQQRDKNDLFVFEEKRKGISLYK